MKTNPLPHSAGISTRAISVKPVSLVSTILGCLALVFGVGLAVLTLAGAADGFAAIGFYDIAVGSMFLTFSWYASKFGYEVVTGRQSVTGELLG